MGSDKSNPVLLTPEKIRSRALLAVFLTVFLDLVGFGMFIPVVVNVATDFGANPTQAASINTWYSIGTLISVLFLGRLSDLFGRKKLLMATIGLSAAAHLATGFSPNFLMLLLVRFIAGAAAGNISVAQACIADLTEPKTRARSMVIIGLAFGGGFALGPALGALVARFAGDSFLPLIGIVACVLNLFNLFFVSRLLPESHPKYADDAIKSIQTWGKNPEESWAGQLSAQGTQGNMFRDFSTLVKTPALRVIFLMQFLQIFGFVGLETVLPLILKNEYELSTIKIYDAFMILGISVLLINGLVARRVLAQIDERIGVKIGQFSLCLGILGVHLLVPSVMGLYASLLLIATGTSFTNPSVSSLTSKLCPSDQLGLSFGALQVVGAVARILGPVTMGLLYKMLGGSESLWFTVILIAAASLFSFWIPKPTGTVH